MFSGYQEQEEYEDELYAEEDDGISEPDSELEFQLYSQLHYCTNQQEDKQGSPVHENPEKAPQPVLRVLPHPIRTDEVIVIDSGPDVISVSDNTEEDEDSVYTKKGRRTAQANPTHKAILDSSSRYRRESAEDVSRDVMVVDSESESDSETHMPFVMESDLDVDSDSDALESWMILGQGKEDGDQKIQLNVLSLNRRQNAVSNEGDPKKWAVSNKDKAACISNKATRSRLSNRYYTEKRVTCHNCGKTGHLSKNCPVPKKAPCCLLCGLPGHFMKTCPNRHCSNCALPGHTYDDCLERAYWHKRCHRCNMTGHFADACPDIWRQYHITTIVGLPTKSLEPEANRSPAYCYNCAKKGHFGHECSARRMCNGTYPTRPFSSYYDTKQDFARREYRTRIKAQELHEAGLLELDEVISTPEPLHKKAKVTHSTPNTGTPKRRIAHTPKQHPKSTPKPNTHLRWGAGASTPVKKTPPGPHSAFTPQLEGKKKKKKKKNVQNKVMSEPLDFPRSPWNSASHTPPFRAKNSPGTLFTSTKSKKKQRRDAKRARKAGQILKEDEDLFLIKQRKRSR